MTCYNNKPVGQQKVQAPLLCSSWKPDGSQVAAGACDNSAYLWDIQKNACQKFGSHNASVKRIHFVDNNVVVTGSWDRTIKYWDLSKNTSTPAATVNVPERVYCSDQKNMHLVVGCADKKLRVYDLRNPSNVVKEITTTLKHQFRCVAMFPDESKGLCVGSIEGRVMVHTYNDSGRTFAYKCHRSQDTIFAVHAIKFHSFGTFLTAGADGSILFWDKDQKQKLKTLNKCPQPIVDADFNKNFTMLAYASSYDWGRGQSGQTRGSQLYIRQVQPTDVERKKK